MQLSLDTFLTSLYYFLDLLVQRHFPALSSRPGPPPSCSPSELLTLSVLSRWISPHSERAFLRYAALHLSPYFPRLPSQSTFNSHSRFLAPYACAIMPLLSQELMKWCSLQAHFEIIDGVACKIMSIPRGKRTKLLQNVISIGLDPTQDVYYFGVKIEMVINSAGLPTGFVIGPAKTDERVLTEALLHERAEPGCAEPSNAYLARAWKRPHNKGSKRAKIGKIRKEGAGLFTKNPYLVDSGITGESMEKHWRENYKAIIFHKKLFEGKEGTINRYRSKQLSACRQRIETSLGWQEEVLKIKRIKARTQEGIMIRVASVAIGYAMSIGINYKYNRPTYSQIQLMTLG
jgi:hypothetical protein